MKLLGAAATFLAAATCSAVSPTISSNSDNNVVEVNDTASGAVFVGVSSTETGSGSVDSFKGIRYATVGRRFSVAKMESYARGDFINATQFGAPCFQPPPTDPNEPAMSEECLHLNIYRPSALAQQKQGARDDSISDEEVNGKLLPVAFWIHGGGFISGSSSIPFYDGSRFAQLEEGFVVVTINYRLGPLGFLCIDDMCNRGMNGVRDQIIALQWVQKHVTSFGGDPTQVSIFGQSAGSLSCCALAVSPLAKGLFNRAILQSGSCISQNWGPGETAEGIKTRDAFLKSVKASTIEEVQNATRFPMEKFMWPEDAFGQRNGAPCVGGEELPVHPRHLYEKGDIHVDSLLLGGTTFDGLGTWVSPKFLPRSIGDYDTLFDELYSEYTISERMGIYATYRPENYFNGSYEASFIQLQGDSNVVCPSLQLANLTHHALQQSGGKVYFYQFGHLYGEDVAVQSGVVRIGKNRSDWASHAGDIPFVFGETKGPAVFPGPTVQVDVNFTQEEECLFQTTSGLWASFMRTGVPKFPEPTDGCKAPAPAKWPEFGSSSSRGIKIAADGSTLLNETFKVENCKILHYNSAPRVLGTIRE